MCEKMYVHICILIVFIFIFLMILLLIIHYVIFGYPCLAHTHSINSTYLSAHPLTHFYALIYSITIFNTKQHTHLPKHIHTAKHGLWLLQSVISLPSTSPSSSSSHTSTYSTVSIQFFFHFVFFFLFFIFIF